MDMVESRLQFCREKLGIDHTIVFSPEGSHLTELEKITGGELADAVIDATGSVRSMSTCFNYAAFTGRVIYVGITTETLSFPHAPVFHRRELTLLASRNALPADFGKIINLIADGEIDTDIWITDRLTFDDVPTEFAAFTDPSRGTVKAIIEIA
jgi:alcohol dehydrogenase